MLIKNEKKKIEKQASENSLEDEDQILNSSLNLSLRTNT